MKKTVIFLDIDGVLNRPETQNKISGHKGVESSLVWKLREIVRFLDADIVLSSSWKQYWNKDLINDGIDNWRGRSPKRFGRYLNLRLGKYGLKIADKTEDVHWSKRAEEILNYLEDHPEIESFVILDDEDFRWAHYGLERHWVDTSYYDEEYGIREEGITDDIVEYIKNNVKNFKIKESS